MIFHAQIEHGKTRWREPAKVAQFVSRLEGKKIVVTIEKWHGQRSSQANRFYWGVVVDAISDNTGYEKVEVHALMGQMFLLSEEDGCPFVRSTALLNTTEFSDFLEKVIRFAAMELGVIISDPG